MSLAFIKAPAEAVAFENILGKLVIKDNEIKGREVC
jgi:hypothetical protein